MDALKEKPAEMTPAQWVSALHSTALADVRLPCAWESFPSDLAFEAWLSFHGLPKACSRRLLVTREHADFGYSGGIGSYCEELCRLFGSDSPAVVYLGRDNKNPRLYPSEKFLRQHRWITPTAFLPENIFTALSQDDLALYMVLAATAFYPNLETIEVQDCDGVGARVIQAKMAGILPENLEIEVTAHGTQVYVENASKILKGDCDHLRRMALEKISLENADRVIFPTRFLETLYAKKGYRIAKEKCRILRYPFSIPENQPDFRSRPASTLVFYGRTDRMKGFDIFVDALMLLPSELLEKFGEILVLGKADPYMRRENRTLSDIGRRVKIVRKNLSRKAAVAELARLGLSGLVICPYRADNHPNCVMEAQFCGCRLLAANSGGIPELVPTQFHREVLFSPEPPSLAQAISQAVSRPNLNAAEIAERLYSKAIEIQHEINREHLDRLTRHGSKPSKPKYDKFILTQEPEPKVVMVINGESSSCQPVPDESQGVIANPVFFLTNENHAQIRFALASHAPDFIAFGSCLSALQPESLAFFLRFLKKNQEFKAVTGYFSLIGAKNDTVRISRPIGDGLVLGVQDAFDQYRAGLIRFSAWKALPGASLAFQAIAGAIMQQGDTIGVIPQISGEIVDYPAAGIECSTPPFPGLGIFESARLEAALGQFRELQKSPAWKVAGEVSRNPRILALGKFAFRVLGIVFKAGKKIPGR